MIAIEFDYWITTDSFRVPHAGDSLSIKHELKSNAILYHVDISRQLFASWESCLTFCVN